MKKLIIGTLFLIVSISLVIYNEVKINNGYYTNIYSITNSESKTENIKVYLEATFIAGTIKNDNNNSFYVVFGDGVQYIVYMNNKLANKINKYLLDNPEKSYKIVGLTKTIPKDLLEPGKKFVKMWLDENHHHDSEEHSHNISNDEFYHYFGYVYLDTNLNNSINLIIYITGFIGLILVLNFIIKKYHLL